MNVCHVLTMTRRGGVETMLMDYLRSVQSPDIRHYVMTTSSDRNLVGELKVEEHYEPLRSWRFDPRAVRQMADWMKARRIDVVHGYNAVGNTYGSLAARRAGVSRILTSEHGTINSLPFWRRPGDRWAQRSARIAIANSKASRILMRSYYGIEEARISVVPNAVCLPAEYDRKAARIRLALPEGPIIGAVGRLDSVKAFEIFLHAAAELQKKRKDLNVVLVGGGPEEDKLRQIREKMPDPERVLMTGWRADARELISAMDILVSTSISESSGNTLLEAGAAGVPVIAPAVGGIPEVVLDGITGHLLNPTLRATGDTGPYKTVVVNGQLDKAHKLDPEQLAGAIHELLSDPERCRLMGDAAREHVAEKHSMARYEEDLIRLYRGN